MKKYSLMAIFFFTAINTINSSFSDDNCYIKGLESQSAIKSYYDLLGVSQDVEPKEVKAKYYRLALVLHPDRQEGSEGNDEAFKSIQEAYSVLSDFKKRKEYDEHCLNKKGKQQISWSDYQKIKQEKEEAGKTIELAERFVKIHKSGSYKDSCGKTYLHSLLDIDCAGKIIVTLINGSLDNLQIQDFFAKTINELYNGETLLHRVLESGNVHLLGELTRLPSMNFCIKRKRDNKSPMELLIEISEEDWGKATLRGEKTEEEYKKSIKEIRESYIKVFKKRIFALKKRIFINKYCTRVNLFVVVFIVFYCLVWISTNILRLLFLNDA